MVICVNVFCYEKKMVYPVYLSNQSFNDSMDLLLISNHYVYIKDFNRLMFNKSKNKNEKWFCKSCLQCFSSKKVLIKHKEDCLAVNGCQNVKLEKGFIEFKNFNRQIPVPFEIYADFECLLKPSKKVLIMIVLVILVNIKTMYVVVLLINRCVLIINLVKMLHCTEEKMLF